MRMLLAEDDRTTARLMERRLERWGYEVIKADNGKRAWEILSGTDAPELVLLDWMMPEMNGVEVCHKTRELDIEPYHYIILLTSRGDREDIIEGLEAGADDYLKKPVDPQELRMRIRAGKRIIQLQKELITAREKLRFQATHDTLTGLPNRALTMTSLTKEIARCSRENKEMAVIMADLDHFKRVNDTWGHLAGDAVLREAAARFQSAIRPYDEVGRYGGEEFLFVLSNCNNIPSRALAERVRRRISDTPIIFEGEAIPITVSLGLAFGRGDIEASELIRRADLAMYEAKETGRDRVKVYQES